MPNTAEERIAEMTDYSRRERHVYSATGITSMVVAAHSWGGQSIGDGGRLLTSSGVVAVRPVGDHYEATVNAGTTWQQLLKQYLIPRSMQAYYDLTVGGSISVNAHGGFWMCPSVGQIITSMRVDSEVLTQADPKFWHVVGGYGLCGHIDQSTVKCDRDCFLDEYRMLMKPDMIAASDRQTI